jgi:CheY-like chemotaxis protein
MIDVIDSNPGPLMLLVDDDGASLQQRRAMYDDVGFATLAVEDEYQAIREFIASPGVDVVITDIRLHAKMPLDKSGVKLARQLKAINPDLPIVGYSAAFAENELTDEERSLFTSFHARGNATPREIVKNVLFWKEIAIAAAGKRLAEAQTRLQRYREKYGQTSPEFSIMRFLVPNRLVHTDGDISSVEDVLRRAGFELRLINRGTERPTVTDSVAHLQSPLMLWLRRDGEVTISEVYGFSEFYSYGDNEEEAIANVLRLMDGFHRDFESEKADGTRNLQIAQFLNSIF